MDGASDHILELLDGHIQVNYHLEMYVSVLLICNLKNGQVADHGENGGPTPPYTLQLSLKLYMRLNQQAISHY